jgi:cadmium resistance protein CadD (predicted permease)
LLPIANGADNIGVYIPLFTGMGFNKIMIVIMVFMLLTALWCYIGSKLANYPMTKKYIKKYERIFIPTMYISLGIFIFIKNNGLDIIWGRLKI